MNYGVHFFLNNFVYWVAKIAKLEIWKILTAALSSWSWPGKYMCFVIMEMYYIVVITYQVIRKCVKIFKNISVDQLAYYSPPLWAIWKLVLFLRFLFPIQMLSIFLKNIMIYCTSDVCIRKNLCPALMCQISFCHHQFCNTCQKIILRLIELLKKGNSLIFFNKYIPV